MSSLYSSESIRSQELFVAFLLHLVTKKYPDIFKNLQNIKLIINVYFDGFNTIFISCN